MTKNVCCIAAILFSSLTLSPIAMADDHQDAGEYRIQLSYIESKKTTEKGGDELFFNVTTYSSLGRSNHYQAPAFPMHWKSEVLDQVTNVTLWTGDLEADESLEVILSLTERDAPPWDIDDLIGSVKVKLHASDAGLADEWHLYAKRELTTEVDGPASIHEYKMTGDGGEYQIGLILEKTPKH